MMKITPNPKRKKRTKLKSFQEMKNPNPIWVAFLKNLVLNLVQEEIQKNTTYLIIVNLKCCLKIESKNSLLTICWFNTHFLKLREKCWFIKSMMKTNLKMELCFIEIILWEKEFQRLFRSLLVKQLRKNNKKLKILILNYNV